MLKRWLSVFLATVLCCVSLPAAVGEDLSIDEAIEIEQTSGAQPDDLSLPPELTEAVLERNEVLEEDLPIIEADGQWNDAETFVPGYWRVTTDRTRLYADAEGERGFAWLMKGADLLAVGQSGEQLETAFDSERGVITGYVDAGNLKKLSDAKQTELKQALTRGGDAALYRDGGELPLPRPACEFDEASDATELPAQANALPEGAEAEANGGPSLKLSATKLTIGVKEKCKILTATLGEANSGDTVTWSSNKKAVAKVNAKTGVITGVKTGTATITAKTSGGLKKSCKVTVAKAPGKVKLAPKALTLSVGQSQAVKATLPAKTGSTLTYKSSKNKVATVDANGVITAVATGSATITVNTFNKKKATCKVTVVNVPDQVFLPETFTVAEKERKTIEASVVDENNAASVASYTYTAENGTGEITVDSQTGEVVGVKAGTATIRVTTHNGVSTHLSGEERVETLCQVTVTEGPAKVGLEVASATIGVKQSLALKPVLLNSAGEAMKDAKYTVATSDSKKATVSAKGVVKGVKKGNVTITVTAFNGVKATCKVKVVSAPSKVSLTPAKPVLSLGQTQKLKVSFPSGTMASYTFSSSDERVVSVDNEGNITGLMDGSAVIKVRTHNSKTAKVTVKVLKDPKLLALNTDYDLIYDEETGAYWPLFTKTLKPDKTFQISCESEYGIQGASFEYQSDNPDVATVSDEGLVTAVEPGVANITVLSSTGTTATLRVTVSGTVAEKIAFVADSASVLVGRSVAAPGLKGANISASALKKATYESGNERIFTVAWDKDENRWMLTGVKAGTAKLTAKAGNAKAQLTVTVSKAAEASSIRFEDELVYMSVGESFTPRVFDDTGAQTAAALTSDDSAVVSVDESGELTAVGEGSAIITATQDALTATMTVVVRGDGASLSLNVENLTMGVGERFALKARVNGDGGSTKLTYKTSAQKVATVTSQGVIVARAAGIATITAQEAGGASATCEVVVGPAPTALYVQPASVSLRMKAGGVQLSWMFGDADEIGWVTFSSSNPDVASVDDDGYVTFNAPGTAKISAVANNGLVTTVPVTVLPDKEIANRTTYRLFAAYSYHDDLPFTKRNATTMASVFEKADIGGQTYATKVMGNPLKPSLLAGMDSFFEDTDDNDVSIVYLCSHGHNNKSTYSDYYMSLKGFASHPDDSNYFITGKEIFNSVSQIRGSVVLILDSCYSGTFIEDMQGKLDAEGGRIAVLTAASNTRATYYNKKTKSVDFFTFFLLQGLGYNEREGWWNKNSGGSQGSYPGYLAADKNGDGNGFVTLSEFYSFAAKCIDANIPSYMKKSWYWGDKKKVQKTRFYAGNLKNLVVYQPK